MSQQPTIWRPFLLFRSTLFALLTWFSVTALGFGIWEIIALKSSGVFAYGAPIFVILNSCATLMLMLVAIAEICIRNVKTAQVNFECAWTFVMAIMHFAAAVDVTVMGPPQFCSNQALVNVCAASTVLAVATWLSSVTMMLYFLALYMSAISHYWVYGGVWTTTVYNVPWFSKRDIADDFHFESPPTKISHDLEKLEVKSDNEKHVYDVALTPTTPMSPISLFNYSHFSLPPRGIKVPPLVHASSKGTLRPDWAKTVNTRRGVDQPFTLPGAKHLSRIFKACMLDTAPAPPPKTYILPQLNLDLTPRYPSYSHFPESVYDENKPVTSQRLSQWIRADGASGRTRSSS